MVTRRNLVLAVGAAVVSSRAFSQQRAGAHRIGILSSLAPSSRDAAFVQALIELGYTEGKNIHLERRYPGGDAARLEQSARELLERGVQVIFAPTTIAASAAKRLTTLPVVFATAPDPVGSGLVATLARPGGNATGTTSVATELNAKRVQLLKEAFPQVSRMAVLRSREPVVAVHVAEIERLAKQLGLSLLVMEVTQPQQLEAALQRLQEWRADAINVVQSTTNFNNRKLLAELAARASIPAVFPYSESVEAGGLMSYGTDFDDLYRRAAVYVDKILKGAKPADLPVEQPTKFELAVNLKTANALPFRMSPAILLRADKTLD
jgi:putative tryptophan/tyrosine transport system substrate-binding protein